MDKKMKSLDGMLLRPTRLAPKRDVIDLSAKKSERVTLDNVTSGDLENKRIDMELLAQPAKPAPKKPIDAEQRVVLDEDINVTLNDLNEYESGNLSDIPKDKKLKKLKKIKKPSDPKKRKKIIKIIITVFIALILAAGGFFAYKIFIAGDNIFDGSMADLFKGDKLLEDENGRSNILIFGTAPEDEDGPLLADSIMVLSIHQTDKTAYTISLPRDLYVKHYCPNPAMNTTSGKLNETYRCVYDPKKDNEEEAQSEFRKIAGEILGIDVQYSVRLSYEAVISIVDAVGGIEITIESDDPRGIFDYNTGIKFANGETVHMDGELALLFARARGAGGGYGITGSNYFREKSQQKIIKSLQAKALSSDILSNPITALNIISALGDSLRTNFKTSEVRTIIDLAKKINTNDIVSIPLNDPENDRILIVSDMINEASVEVPAAGKFNYSEIHKYIAGRLSNDPIVSEAAMIDVLNGSGEEGVAKLKATELETMKFRIGKIDNAPAGTYEAVEVYQLNSAKTKTAKALKKRYNVEIKTALPAGILNTADFVIIFGTP